MSGLEGTPKTIETLAKWIGEFENSPEFQKLTLETQRHYRRWNRIILHFFGEGQCDYRDITKERVNALLSSLEERYEKREIWTANAGRNCVAALRRIIRFANNRVQPPHTINIADGFKLSALGVNRLSRAEPSLA